MTTAHGPNIGHGYTKYLIIDDQGVEQPPVIIPSVIARAGRRVSGALAQAETVDADGQCWWVGFERELSILETDLAARTGALRVAGTERRLPEGWDRPLCENGEAVAARLVEEWGSGASLDLILIGGGGTAEERLAQAIQSRFPHARVIEQPQLAIARGYARLARRLGGDTP